MSTCKSEGEREKYRQREGEQIRASNEYNLQMLIGWGGSFTKSHICVVFVLDSHTF